MTESYSPHLVRLVQQVVKSAIDQSQRKTRHSGSLSGTVEDIDDELDIVYVRMDQETMGSDPTVSDNYEMPGVIPVTRIGEAYINEQVRVVFDPGMTANALRTSTENKIVLPYGREEGQRIILDGNTGAIGFFNEDDELVGYLDALQWFVGTDDIGRVRLDPIGGVRLWDENSQVRILMSAEEGLQVRDGATGITGVAARHDGIVVADPETGDTIAITSGNRSSTPPPKWAATEQQNPTTAHSTPAIASFDTGDDLDLRFVAASTASNLGAQSYAPPAGYTEIADVNSSGGVTLQVGAAYKAPSDAAPPAANFTSTSASFTRRTGHSVIVRGGGASSPAVADVEVGLITTHSTSTIPLTIDLPATTADGDLLVVHVCLAGGAIPVGWTVPPGWAQLGVHAAGVGTSHILGSGVWYKLHKSGDPLSADLFINMTAAVPTKIHAVAARVTDAYAFPAGLDIRRNNRSMPRGLVAEDVAVTGTGLLTNAQVPATIASLNNVEMLAGRTYRVAYDASSVVFAALSTGCRAEITIDIDDGSGWVQWYRVYTRQLLGSGTDVTAISNGRNYIPPANQVVNWRVQIKNGASGSGWNIQLTGSDVVSRTFSITDTGATY